MRSPFRPTVLAGAASLALLAGQARAADVTAAQAAEAEAALRTWLGSVVGPSLKIGERPIQLTPAGDHFDVVVPIRIRAEGSPAELRMTATARPLEGGKWAVETMKMATPMRFTLDMPTPVKDSDKTTLSPVNYVVDVGSQDGSMMLDPSFQTPSTWSMSLKNMTSTATGERIQQRSSMASSSSVTNVKPAGGDRVDASTEGVLEGYRVESRTEGIAPIVADLRSVRVAASMNGVSRAKATGVTQALATLVATAVSAPAGKDGTPQAPSPEVIRTLLAALQDLASTMDVDETFDGIAVRYDDTTVLLERAMMGLGVRSEGGMLQARMDLGAQGLTLPDMPLGGMEVLIPGRLALRPFVSNLSVADLMRIAQKSSDGQEPGQADIAALFSHGGIVGGLESMAVEVGGARFTGNGRVTATSPNAFSGIGQVTAENFDALMQKVSAVPALAQGVPAMALIKGMGRIVDNRLVWDITYRDNKLLVNNVDIGAMTGQKPAPGGQRQPAPRRQ